MANGMSSLKIKIPKDAWNAYEPPRVTSIAKVMVANSSTLDESEDAKIDPRLLDGTWQSYQDQDQMSSTSSSSTSTQAAPTRIRDFVRVAQPIIEPLSPVILSPPQNIYPSPSTSAWDVFLPSPLINKTVNTAEVHSKWCEEPRRTGVVKCVFKSREGKRKFVELVKSREKKEKKREYDRARRATMKAERTR